MDATLENWFPTQVLVIEASHLIEDGKTMFAATDFGATISSKYPNGATTYYSGGGLPTVENKDWSIFIESLTNATLTLAEKQGVDVMKRKAHLGSIWLSRINREGKHPIHAHAGSHYSGTFYVETPLDCGNLRIHNPLANLWGLAMPPIDTEGIPSTSMYVDYVPKSGLLLIWNSWLYHEVLPSKTDSNRDSISFNFFIN